MSQEESAEKRQSESVWFARKNNLCIEPSPPCLSTVCRYHTTELHFTRNVFCFFYRLNACLERRATSYARSELQASVARLQPSARRHGWASSAHSMPFIVSTVQISPLDPCQEWCRQPRRSFRCHASQLRRRGLPRTPSGKARRQR